MTDQLHSAMLYLIVFLSVPYLLLIFVTHVRWFVTTLSKVDRLSHQVNASVPVRILPMSRTALPVTAYDHDLEKIAFEQLITG